ncbi:MAG: ribonuclease P protein component [marine benthic group bacterium]|nr:ribonuclease P protein component [Candidatus Benthicola marisminoris]
MREGARRRCGPLEFISRTSETSSPRAGIIVPRYGRTNVERNRLKRRLRALVRSDWLPEARSRGLETDVLVRARPEAYERTLDQLRAAFSSWESAA